MKPLVLFLTVFVASSATARLPWEHWASVGKNLRYEFVIESKTRSFKSMKISCLAKLAERVLQDSEFSDLDVNYIRFSWRPRIDGTRCDHRHRFWAEDKDENEFDGEIVACVDTIKVNDKRTGKWLTNRVRCKIPHAYAYVRRTTSWFHLYNSAGDEILSGRDL